MGGGTYSSSTRAARATDMGYFTKSARETFSERSINNAMNPRNVDIRESRDSDEHPNSLAIILALDVTGSMGSIPHFLVKDGLPHIMESIINGGINDPQLLFLGIGDHECDQAPLQVGQFESSDELLDHWLTSVWLEGGGGGNAGESYMLAWYFAGFHTSIDCFEKRNQKGFLFTIGDEPVLRSIPERSLREIMGQGQHVDYTAAELLDKAREAYNVYHLHLSHGYSSSSDRLVDNWKQIMGDGLIVVNRKEEVATRIIEIVTSGQQAASDIQKTTETESPNEETEVIL